MPNKSSLTYRWKYSCSFTWTHIFLVVTQRKGLLTFQIFGLGHATGSTDQLEVVFPNEADVHCYKDQRWTKLFLWITWLIALTDNYTFWEFTKYSKHSSKIRSRLHAKGHALRMMHNCTDYLCTTPNWQPLRFSDRYGIQSAGACGAAVPLPSPSHLPLISIRVQPLHLLQMTRNKKVNPSKYCSRSYFPPRLPPHNIIQAKVIL
jgi:hypothetical protein